MPADRIGQQLGNYRLLRLLGSGGFADVYLGEHVYLNSRAAIKVLHTRLADDDVLRFVNEARTIVKLHHPNIVRLLDFGVNEDNPFLIMDYAPSGTLRQRHPRGVALPLETVIPYVRQVASALQYAHNQKLIHRDVKPENMFIGLDNEILLGDFGIALIAQSSRFEGTKSVLGSAAYMAPEQFRGQALPASDQYALGMVVYEWLSGTRPFIGSLTEIAVQHTVVSPPSLGEKNPSLSADVEQVVMTALAKDPKDRFASVQAFATALEQAYLSASNYPTVLSSPSIYPGQSTLPPAGTTPSPPVPQFGSSPHVPSNLYTLSGQSPLTEMPFQQVQAPPLQQVQAPPQEAPQPLKRGISRRAVLVGLVGLTGLAAAEIAASGVTWQKLFQGPGVSTATPGLGTTLLTYRGHADTVDAVAWSPDGKRIASGSWDHTVQVWDATTGTRVFTYFNHTSTVEALMWSPDGTQIVSGGADRTVQVWDATIGTTSFVYHGHTAPVNAVAWSPGGKLIASGSADKTVQVWDIAAGTKVSIYRGHTAPINAVAWSPDGKLIASGSTDDTIQLWDAATGTRVFTYSNHSAPVNAVAWSPDGKYIASGSVDRTVQVWDATTGTRAFTYRGYSDIVSAVVWSPDGHRIASGSLDGTVRVLDATTGGHVFIYNGHLSRVFALAWSPDGKHITSGSADKTVKVWDAV